ncbi:MAG: HNH endonuclease [Solirubrobacteraceae bacterium]
MLRPINDARFVRQNLTLAGWRWAFYAGERAASDVRYRTRDVRRIAELQQARPVDFLIAQTRTGWAFEGRYYWADPECGARDVLALVRERERRRTRKLERAHAALAATEQPRREPIPREVKLAVWQRDGGRCVDCDTGFDLQYDHVIPVVMGGASSAQNLQLLCGDCNRAKGGALV